MESLLCPVLIERSDELKKLSTALDEAAQGRGQTIFVTGDAGVGKSRLVREAAELASDRGFHVLTGRGTESTVPVPYRPVTEALMGAARTGVTPDSPPLTDYRSALGTLVPEWRQPQDRTGHISAMILGEAVLRLLTQPGWHGGLLVLEDLHWADPETLSFVEYLTDNIGGTTVLCLITQRDVDGSPAAGPAPFRDHQARGRCGRCAAADARRRSRGWRRRACPSTGVPRGGEPAAGRLRRPAVRGRGDPGRLGVLRRAHPRATPAGEVDPGVSTGVPDSIAGSVRNRLNALGAAMAGVLVSAAILGRQFDWALLPKVSPASETDVLAALKRARELGLIEPVGTDGRSFKFRHSLTRDAIVADLLPPNVASKSAAAAAAIEQAHPGLPGTWCELAAELQVAAGQPVAAARLLLTAGYPRPRAGRAQQHDRDPDRRARAAGAGAGGRRGPGDRHRRAARRGARDVG